MPTKTIVDFAVVLLVFLGISALVSIVVAMPFPKVRVSRSRVCRVIVGGTAAGVVAAEIWAQFYHHERLGRAAITICIVVSLIWAVVSAVVSSRSDSSA